MDEEFVDTMDADEVPVEQLVNVECGDMLVVVEAEKMDVVDVMHLDMLVYAEGRDRLIVVVAENQVVVVYAGLRVGICWLLCSLLRRWMLLL